MCNKQFPSLMTMVGVARANLPADAEGRLYHIGLKKGEASHLVILCGDELRATSISTHFDHDGAASVIRSSRGFLTINGTFNGHPLTIMAIGMGYPMMDFAVRELRAIVDGPMLMVRLGSCGFITNPCHKTDSNGDGDVIGMIAVAGHGSCIIQRNYDHQFSNVDGDSCFDAYRVSGPFPADQQLSNLLIVETGKVFGRERVLNVLNLSADSFYSSQGRPSEAFSDCNDKLLEEIRARFCPEPASLTLEMESGQLLHLAGCTASAKDRIIASAMHIVVSDRETNRFLVDLAARDRLDRLAGLAVLRAITQYDKEYLSKLRQQ
jgi:uridine phosphorylase